jgi:hypothetical protein
MGNSYQQPLVLNDAEGTETPQAEEFSPATDAADARARRAGVVQPVISQKDPGSPRHAGKSTSPNAHAPALASALQHEVEERALEDRSEEVAQLCTEAPGEKTMGKVWPVQGGGHLRHGGKRL